MVLITVWKNGKMQKIETKVCWVFPCSSLSLQIQYLIPYSGLIAQFLFDHNLHLKCYPASYFLERPLKKAFRSLFSVTHHHTIHRPMTPPQPPPPTQQTTKPLGLSGQCIVSAQSIGIACTVQWAHESRPHKKCI